MVLQSLELAYINDRTHYRHSVGLQPWSNPL